MIPPVTEKFEIVWAAKPYEYGIAIAVAGITHNAKIRTAGDK
jgi:hypothetical protein